MDTIPSLKESNEESKKDNSKHTTLKCVLFKVGVYVQSEWHYKLIDYWLDFKKRGKDFSDRREVNLDINNRPKKILCTKFHTLAGKQKILLLLSILYKD